MIVYLAGPYSGNVDDNISRARKISIELWEAGYYVVCPHLNTAHFEIDCRCTYENYMRGDIEILSKCDAVVMLPGWQNSAGASREKKHAAR